MKSYTIEEILAKAPLGTNYIHYGVYRSDYINHDDKGYRVWLGIKHGGWSIRLNFKHPRFNELLSVLKLKASQNHNTHSAS